MGVEKEITNAIEHGTIILGAERTLKELKKGKIATVILASNAPEDVRMEVTHLSSITKTNVIEFDGDSKELGALCRKPFFVAVVGIKKGK